MRWPEPTHKKRKLQLVATQIYAKRNTRIYIKEFAFLSNSLCRHEKRYSYPYKEKIPFRIILNLCSIIIVSQNPQNIKAFRTKKQPIQRKNNNFGTVVCACLDTSRRRYAPRGARKQKRHSLGVNMTRGKFAPSYKLPTGKDGAMLRTPIPRSRALGSS